ncbi:uncharacterized protein LOC122643564 [Telopea speciosissima]|uniref:uncharacterized protein LOC122643564 n=1 Tax=Telopea speciosissima TaxID=54955 RepID=UPI001CC3D212|nr:uncharacterized protein LOC122643564 [Telopea speciosissima]
MAGLILVPYQIWNERNRRRFEGQGKNSIVIQHLIKVELRDASSLMKCLIKSVQDLLIAHQIGTNFPYTQANRIIEIRWRKPNVNWVKLNIDGCSMGNPGHSSAAGIYRNSQGQPIGSFAQYLGITTNHYAKFSAFFIGVQKAKEKNINHLWIECDAEVIVAAVKKENIPWKFKQAWLGAAHYL